MVFPFPWGQVAQVGPQISAVSTLLARPIRTPFGGRRNRDPEVQPWLAAYERPTQSPF